MPQREQLALIGESDNQMHFTSETWGLLTFFPTKGSKWNDTCRHCLLWHPEDKEECANAHCTAESRADGQNGYYSIHDMPDWAKRKNNAK